MRIKQRQRPSKTVKEHVKEHFKEVIDVKDVNDVKDTLHKGGERGDDNGDDLTKPKLTPSTQAESAETLNP